MFQCQATCTLVFRGCFCLVERYIHEVMLKRAVDVGPNLCQLSTAWPRGALGGLCWWRHARGFDPWLGVLNTTGWKYPVQWPWMTMTLTEFAKMNVKPTPCPSIDALIKVSNAEIRDAWRSSQGIIPESVVVPQLASRGVENAYLPREAPKWWPPGEEETTMWNVHGQLLFVWKVPTLDIQRPKMRRYGWTPRTYPICNSFSRVCWYFLYFFKYIYGCFLKWWYPQNTPKWSFLVGKPMVVGYHHLRTPPCIYIYTYIWDYWGLPKPCLINLT